MSRNRRILSPVCHAFAGSLAHCAPEEVFSATTLNSMENRACDVSDLSDLWGRAPLPWLVWLMAEKGGL